MVKLNLNQITLAWLNSANISNGKIEKLLEYFGCTEELWYNFESEISNINFSMPECDNLLKSKDKFEYYLLKKLKEQNTKIVTIFDDDYPEKLKNISAAPYILYYRGDINQINSLSIAVIGSRKATNYGKWAAEKFTKELSELRINIISGLAAGIDSIAHNTAIKNGTKTIGIIGNGIDIIYPKKNEVLYEKIIESNGAIITEFPFGTAPLSFNFPIRNRIISGLSDGVLIIEAQEKSGTLITAGYAADQGREIFAVPGNIDSMFSKGTNALIKDGAKVVTKIEDIIEEIQELGNRISKSKKNINLSELNNNERKIYESLLLGEKSIYEIGDYTKMEIGDIISSITILELRGIIYQNSNNKYLVNNNIIVQ